MRSLGQRGTMVLLKALLFVLPIVCWADPASRLDPEAVSQAVQFATDVWKDNEQPTTLEQLRQGQIPALHRIAATMMEDKRYFNSAMKILHGLAASSTDDESSDEEAAYVPSQMKLAFYYHNVGNDLDRALYFFELAANAGHPGAMYNAGRLYAEHRQEPVPAMAYIQACCVMGGDDNDGEDEQLSQLIDTCKEAHAKLSQRLGTLPGLAFTDRADLFIFGNVQEIADDSPIMVLWKNAMDELVAAMKDEGTDKEGATEGAEKHKVQALESLVKIYKEHAEDLSLLQTHLVLTEISLVLDNLSFFHETDNWIALAGQYWETLSLSVFCYSSSADTATTSTQLSSWGCFNHAASQAAMNYRHLVHKSPRKSASRAEYEAHLDRVVESGRNHPTAATKWTNSQQTPMVFAGADDDGNALQGKPWWHDLTPFPIATEFKESFYPREKAKIDREIKQLLAFWEQEEGERKKKTAEAEVGADGEVTTATDNEEIPLWQPVFGMTRLGGGNAEDFVYQEAAQKTKSSADTVPLFTTVSLYPDPVQSVGWSTKACEVVPTLCEFVKKHAAHLCTAGADVSADGSVSPEAVFQACATPDVVSITRLRPGTTIRPHLASPTNYHRVTLYACLQGCDEVETTIGGQTVTGYGIGNGGAKVGDESFTSDVVHRGSEDLVLLRLHLGHPDA